MVICVPGGMVFAAAPSGPAAIADPVARPAATIIANNNFSPNFIFFHRVLAKLEIRARADLIRRRFDSKLEFLLSYSNRSIGPTISPCKGLNRYRSTVFSSGTGWSVQYLACRRGNHGLGICDCCRNLQSAFNGRAE